MEQETLHAIGVAADSREQAESVHPRFVREKLRWAQTRSWEGVARIRQALEPGMTEDDARLRALEVFAELGVKKHWHKPYIRFGPGTTRTFHQRLQSDYRARKGDAFFVDVGPIWPDPETGLAYEGDVGDTFSLGSEAPAPAADAARALFREGVALWKARQLSGRALYAELASRAQAQGLTLLTQVDGHRVGDFPHQRHTKARLAELPYAPGPSLWVLEVHVVDAARGLGAFHEDLLE